MYKNGDRWMSEFPPVRGIETPVEDNHSVIASTSYGGMTGGHSAMYLEYMDGDDAIVYKIHLTAGLGGSEQAESTGSGSSASHGVNEINIDIEEKEVNEEHRDRGTTLHYQSWVITNAQFNAFLSAVEKFRNKVAMGRYSYRLAGGAVGWISTRPGKRGVNCADFIIKVLKEAGIANLGSKLINTPKRVAGG